MKLELADGPGGGTSNVVWAYNPATGMAIALPQTLDGPKRRAKKKAKAERSAIKQAARTEVVRTKYGTKVMKAQAKQMKPKTKIMKRQYRMDNWIEQQEAKANQPTYNAAGVDNSAPIPDSWGSEWNPEQQINYNTDPSQSWDEVTEDVEFEEVPQDEGLSFGIPGFGLLRNIINAPIAGVKAGIQGVQQARGGRQAPATMFTSQGLLDRINELETQLAEQKRSANTNQYLFGGGGLVAGFFLGRLIR